MECHVYSEEMEDQDIQNHMSNGLETTLKNISLYEPNFCEHSSLHPYVGMEFDTLSEVKEFYTSFCVYFYVLMKVGI